MTRVERQVIKRSHPLWGVIDDMCFKAKNLYNYANYILRQEFIQNNNYISYRQMNKELKTHEEYKECMSQPANCILRLLDKNWKSYFQAIKQYSKYPNKFLGKPNIPNYKKKNGRCNWIIPNNSCYYDNGELKFRIRKLQSIKWKCGCKGRLIQVRFVPNGSIYTMEIVYQIDNEPCLNDEAHRIMGIDLGVNNLVTASNNIGEPPFIINGRGLKSINQFYNKRKSKLQSGLPKEQFWSKQLDNLTFKRYCRIKNYMHHTSRKIIDWMRKHNIDTLVIGHNKKWKQKCYLNNFVQIPYNILINQLIYKCEENNIRCVVVEESYTSGTSFVDGETPCKENYSKNRRICRGLFQSSSQLINADVNGSLQIIKKVFPNAFDYGVEANLTPTIINACLI
jgi:putative transposase